MVTMDLADEKLLRRLGIATDGVVRSSEPVHGLARRGDLKTKSVIHRSI